MHCNQLDIIRRSATTLPEPQIRSGTGDVTLQSSSTRPSGSLQGLPGRCMEWNDLRDEIGTNVGPIRILTTDRQLVKL